MLRREIYIGSIVWNKSRWLKVPGSNRRVRRPRPKSEWKIFQSPELRIITHEVWNQVQRKNAWTTERYSTGARKGLANRALSVPYILSGILKCGLCGAALGIIRGRGGKYARYGCSQHFNRGACSNDLTIKSQIAEESFFDELQRVALQPEAIEVVLNEFTRQLQDALDKDTGESQQLRKRAQKLARELENFTKAIAEGVPAKALRQSISERERELSQIKEKLAHDSLGKVSQDVTDLRNFAVQKIFNVVDLLRVDPARTKYELDKHIEELRMLPGTNQHGEHCLVGEASWSLIGQAPRQVRNAAENQTTWSRTPDSGVRMVAGAGFEPATFGL